jgi:hypothetical protein
MGVLGMGLSSLRLPAEDEPHAEFLFKFLAGVVLKFSVARTSRHDDRHQGGRAFLGFLDHVFLFKPFTLFRIRSA